MWIYAAYAFRQPSEAKLPNRIKVECFIICTQLVVTLPNPILAEDALHQ
jgi:hypothetical protein